RLGRAAIVQTAPEPRVHDLIAELIRPVEVAHGVQVACRSRRVEAVDVELDPARLQELGQHLGHRRAEPTVNIMAARRAVWSRSSPRASAISRTTRPYCLITFPVQNNAMAVCSLVRVVLAAAPTLLISLNSFTHCMLPSESGGPGRNWSPLSST